MKITAIKGFPVKVGHRNQFVVKIETDAGIDGVGEGGISGHERVMQAMLEHFSLFLIGEDPRRIEHIWQTCYRGAYFEGGKIVAATLSAIDIALWDILGKSLNTPVYQLLGGAVRERIPCFASPGMLTGPHIVETAKSFIEKGWRSLRFNPGMTTEGWTGGTGEVFEPLESIDHAVHWLREIRKAVGPAIELSIDFHHRLSVVEAAYFCQRVADVNLFFIEEPIRAENNTSLRATPNHDTGALRDWRGVFQQMGIRALPGCRVDQLRPGRCLQCRWYHRSAKSCGLVRNAIHRHDAAQSTGTDHHCRIHPLGSRNTELLVSGVSAPIGGVVPDRSLPAVPVLDGAEFPIAHRSGLGVTFNEEAVRDHQFYEWEAPHWKRRDGSYTNW